MTTFNDRERNFENRFAHDQELEFKIKTRRNRLLAEWVAHKVGMDAAHTERYAVAFAQSDVSLADDDKVIARLEADLEQAGAPFIREEVERHFEHCYQEARKQLLAI